METLQDRLLAFIKSQKITKAQFEKIVGLSNGFCDKAGDNTRKSSIDKISIAFPCLNRSWLVTGEGKMLKEQSTSNLITNNSGVAVQQSGTSINIGNVVKAGADPVNEKIEELQAEITQLRIELEHSRTENTHLRELLAEKERLISVLMKQ